MAAGTGPLQPLPYHLEVVAYLQEEESALWTWFASVKTRTEHTERLRADLLRSCYRLDAAAHPDLFAAATQASERLGLSLPITLWQSQEHAATNAALYFVPGEGHLVFSGSLLALLGPAELIAVIGHELAHHHLWSADDGKFFVADRLLSAIGSHPNADSGHLRCAHRFRLVTELFADRGGFVACGSLPTAVAALVEIETGFAGVSGESYLRQAKEIVGSTDPSKFSSHPETFLRARSLEKWTLDGDAANAEIEGWLSTGDTLDALDVVAQRRATALTRRLVADLLRRDTRRSEIRSIHARQFFPDIAPATAPDPALYDEIRVVAPPLREYFAYVLLDFAVVDPDLADEALPGAVLLGRQIGVDRALETIAPKDLGLRPKEWGKVLQRAAELGSSEKLP